ncbi:MAG: D-alanine--D-alanine ligase [Ruminococcus sp.]|nr:D-alanine--D-alanine ligase [Ruminococcus sp.]
MAKLKVAVIFGGKSNEHDVSLISAAHVINSIPKDKFDVYCIGITKKGSWYKYIGSTENIKNGEWVKHPDNVRCILSPDPMHKGFIALDEDGGYQNIKVDCIFPMLHGKNGEDGTIQGLFELAQIPFVGCDHISSANCMDKELTHIVLDSHGIKTAPYVPMLDSELDKLDERCREMEEKLTYPMFVKPANCGSSLGVSRAENLEQLKTGIKLAFAHDRKVIVEQGIVGIECECAVMGNHKPFASTVGEICSANEDIYDFEAKYNNEASKTVIPARISETAIERIRETALKAYKAMGCEGLARVDFFLCKGDEPVLNEINTLPGHTPISMYPKLMENAGLSPEQQEEKLIRYAFERADVDYE